MTSAEDGLYKWLLSRLAVAYGLSAAVAYGVVAFILWDAGWMSDVGTWNAGTRAFLIIEFPICGFMAFWIPCGMDFMKKLDARARHGL